MDRCISRLDHLKHSPDALAGYSTALSAIMATAYKCPLGIPASKGKHVFQVAEELLRTAAQTSRLTLSKTQAGWALFTGLMTLGPPVVTPHLPKLLLLWRNAFPRSSKEADAERQRGDGFTWQVTLESRSGALASMQSFITHCPDLITDDVTRRLLIPIDVMYPTVHLQVTLESRSGALASMQSFITHCPDLITDDVTRRLLIPIDVMYPTVHLQVTLESRSGALASMQSFITHCPDLITDDVTRRLLIPIDVMYPTVHLQVTLESRSGALASMQSFITHCPDLITDDVTRRLLIPIDVMYPTVHLQVTLESRSGALASMQSFITHCPDLITDDVTRRLLIPIDVMYPTVHLQVTLESRSGALASMQSFITHCPDLITDDVTRRLLIPIDVMYPTVHLQVTLESRSGALASMQSFITHCPDLITDDVTRRLLIPIDVMYPTVHLQVTLESRSGALASMQSFITHCPDLITDDVTRRLLIPIDAGLTMFSHMPTIINDNGPHLRPLAAVARTRLYSTLVLIKPAAFDGCYSSLLRELAAELSLTDKPGQSATSLLKSMCHTDEAVILGESYAGPDEGYLEECLDAWALTAGFYFGQGEPSICAMEHDPMMGIVGRPDPGSIYPPASQPSNVAVIDAAVLLFGKIFPLVPGKHRLQILEHFADCIRQCKGLRQTAIQVNVVTAFLSSLRHQAEGKVGFDSDQVRTSAINLVVGLLSSNLPALRCAAAESLGRVAQVVGDPHFVASLAQSSFDRLKSCRDVVNRTGFSLALGCLHRYVGGLGSAHHLSTSISVLTALYHDISSPEVQLWAIHAVALIADSGGPMFRGYVDPSLAVSLKLLLTVPTSILDVHRCIGRLIGSLVTCVGPELQSNIGNVVTTRNNFITACSILASHSDPIVVAEAVACLQQLHIFASRHVNLAQLVPELCKMLKNEHLTVRKASVACMRQLAQRDKESEQLVEYASRLVPKGLTSLSLDDRDPVLPDTGLEGALFHLLDEETDPQLRENVEETLHSLCQKFCSSNLLHWLTLCKGILATVSTDLQSLHQEEKVVRITESTDDDGQEDESLSGIPSSTPGHKDRMSRWPTRVFAMDLVRKIMVYCSTERAHFDLALAKELQSGTGGTVLSPGETAASGVDYLVLHLSDLVRMAFMAATSDTTELRLSGLACLQDVISRFASVPEPEFEGHVVLEQFQAQVGAALRPAFAPDTPSNVTAAACEVCSAWIGSGVARDLNDLRRVHQLLVSSLSKIKSSDGQTTLVYSEAAATLERLAILRAWAEVYIVAERQANVSASESDLKSDTLLELVKPELEVLVGQWLQALQDLAIISLPPELRSHAPTTVQLPYIVDGQKSVPAILLATATWLRSTNFAEVNDKHPQKIGSDKLFLVVGTCIEALCNPKISDESEIELYLESLKTVIDCSHAHEELLGDPQVMVEILNVMHRLILTNNNLKLQGLCLATLNCILDGLEKPSNNNVKNGSDAFDLAPGKSIIFAALEVCLCALVRQIPDLYPGAQRSTRASSLPRAPHGARLAAGAQNLVITALSSMSRIPNLARNVTDTLPIILFLLTSTIEYTSRIDSNQPKYELSIGQVSQVTAAGLQTLKSLVSNQPEDHTSENPNTAWIRILQSALLTVLDWRKRPDKVDPVVTILSVAVFLISAPRLVTFVPPKIREAEIDLFVESLKSEHLIVRYKCLQSLQSIFMLKDRKIAVAFFKLTGPLVLQIIRGIPEKKIFEESHALLIPEAMKCMETMISSGMPEPEQNVYLMAYCIEAALDILEVPGSNPPGNKNQHPGSPSRKLHEDLIARVHRWSNNHRNVFTQAVNSLSTARARLEKVLRAETPTEPKTSTSGAKKRAEELKQQDPSIKLTMDFSAFGKK